jgi:hypothetical protein
MLIFKCFPIQVGNFISYGVCKLAYKPPLKRVTPHGVGDARRAEGTAQYEGDQRSWWRDSFLSTAANRFHKELRFFFSLLKRKKEAKKEKNSHSTCIIRFKYHPKFPPTKIPRWGIQAAAAAVTLPFLQLKLGRKVSGDSPLDQKRAPSVAESAL